MPSIVIREVESSTAPAVQAQTNAVYIPGYAVTGPINQPTLCNSLTEFRNIFGTVPYTFRNAQPYSAFTSAVEGNFNEKGSYEKSYIEAADLLNQGIPVIYERVFDEKVVANWTANSVQSITSDTWIYNRTEGTVITYREDLEIPESNYYYVVGYDPTDTSAPYSIIGLENEAQSGDVITQKQDYPDSVSAGSGNGWQDSEDHIVTEIYGNQKKETITQYYNDAAQIQYTIGNIGSTAIEVTIDNVTQNIYSLSSCKVSDIKYDEGDTNEYYKYYTLQESSIITLNLSSIYPGLANTNIKYKLLEEDAPKKIYRLDVKRDGSAKDGVTEISAKPTYFTLIEENASDSVYYFADLNKTLDNSGLVYLTATVTPGVDISEYSFTGMSDYEALAIPTETDIESDEFTVEQMFGFLQNSTTVAADGLSATSAAFFLKLQDKGEFVLRFITSGAYPTLRTFEPGGSTTVDIATKTMLEVARNRGDCTAIIDDIYTGDKVAPSEDESTYATIKSYMKNNSFATNTVTKETVDGYGAMFPTFARYKSTAVVNPTTGKAYTVDMHGSYGYLFNYAKSVNADNPVYKAIAGFELGTLENCVTLLQPFTNAVADACQPRNDIAINCFCNVRPRGYMIWGNRTLKDNTFAKDLTATSFLNVRQTCSSIKREIFYACKSLTFQQNTDILWANFKAQITPLLDSLMSGGGIESYDIIRLYTDKKATVKAKIVLVPIEAVEDWDITVELADSAAIVTE